MKAVRSCEYDPEIRVGLVVEHVASPTITASDKVIGGVGAAPPGRTNLYLLESDLMNIWDGEDSLLPQFAAQNILLGLKTLPIAD